MKKLFYTGDIVKATNIVDPAHEESKALIGEVGIVNNIVKDDVFHLNVLVRFIKRNLIWYCREDSLHTILPNYAEHQHDLKKGGE